MPFGLCNAPATYQRLMNFVYNIPELENHAIFIDDGVNASINFELHLNDMKLLLQRYRECGIQLKFSKCHWFKTQVKFLAHLINQSGILTDSSKIERIKNLPIPRDIKSLRRFVGMCNYYRNFIEHFADIANPLTSLTGKNKIFK